MGETAGSRFVAAIAARDVDGLRAVLAPDVDFKGLTPGRFWEAADPEGVVDAVLGGRAPEPASTSPPLPVATGVTANGDREVLGVECDQA